MLYVLRPAVSLAPPEVVRPGFGRGPSIDFGEPEQTDCTSALVVHGVRRQRAPIVLLLTHAATDVPIPPMVTDIEIRNWRFYDFAVTAGVHTAREALDDLKGPITDLRRRVSMEEQVATPDWCLPGTIDAECPVC